MHAFDVTVRILIARPRLRSMQRGKMLTVKYQFEQIIFIFCVTFFQVHFIHDTNNEYYMD